MSPVIGFIFIIWLIKVVNKAFAKVEQSKPTQTNDMGFETFTNNRLNEKRKRSVYLRQYYVNEQPIFGNHYNYYTDYLVNLKESKLSESGLKEAYNVTTAYHHKDKSIAKAAVKYLRDRRIYINNVN